MGLGGRAGPAWAQMPTAELLAAWDGETLSTHWARFDGRDHFFSDLSELRAFIDLQGEVAGGELAVYDGPGSGVSRESADLVTCHIAHAVARCCDFNIYSRLKHNRIGVGYRIEESLAPCRHECDLF